MQGMNIARKTGATTKKHHLYRVAFTLARIQPRSYIHFRSGQITVVATGLTSKKIRKIIFAKRKAVIIIPKTATSWLKISSNVALLVAQ
jgi:hypothetical protein